MSGFTAREKICRPPTEVFAFLTDIHKSMRWISGMVNVEPLTHGPMRTGTQWSEVRRLGERESKTIVEVIDHQGPKEREKPPYTHVWRSVNMGIETTQHYRVEPEGEDHCNVEFTAIVRGTNWISRLFVPFAVKAMRKHDGSQLSRLKEVVESQPQPEAESRLPFVDSVDLKEESPEKTEDLPSGELPGKEMPGEEMPGEEKPGEEKSVMGLPEEELPAEIHGEPPSPIEESSNPGTPEKAGEQPEPAVAEVKSEETPPPAATDQEEGLADTPEKGEAAQFSETRISLSPIPGVPG